MKILDRLTAGAVFHVVLVLLVAAVTAVALVLGYYLSTFNGPVSPNHKDWAEFGDFLGGTVSTIVALFALFAVLLTLVLQTRELEATRLLVQRSTVSAEQSTLLAASTALLTYANSWQSLTGHVPVAQLQDYKYWVQERGPELARDLDAQYKAAKLRAVA